VSAPTVEERLPGRYAILGLILAAQTVANVGPLGIPAIARLIRDDLGLTLAQAGSFLSAYYIGPIVMSLPAGTLADRWGVKRTLVLGQVVIALGLVAVSTAGSYPTLITLMMVAGIGYGMLNPTSTKAVMAWFPASQRATMIGLKQVGLPFGGALGAALLPVLALAAGWRLAVTTAAILIAVSALASLLGYRDSPREPPAARGEASPVRVVLLARDPWLVALATLVFAGMQTVWLAFAVLYLTDVVGLPLLTASRYLALAQVAGMSGRIAFGLLSDHVFGGRRRAPLVMAGAGSALCSLAIAGIGPGASPIILVPLALVFGFCGVGWNGVQHTLLAELAGPRSAGTAVGLGLAVSSLGVTVTPPLFGWWVERAGSYTWPWIGLALTMVAALILLVPVRERPRLL
jgi:predicted MFS family arabinose efflux permease